MSTTTPIHLVPASGYGACSDIAVLTSYFNPANFKNKAVNFTRFMLPFINSGIRVFTIECVFGESASELSAFDDVLTVRAASVLWQKERLLNHLMSVVPCRYSKLVWLDCDVLFCDDQWLPKLGKALEIWPIVQPFEFVIRLPPAVDWFEGDGSLIESFGSRYNNYPECLTIGEFNNHGHTGYVWAARREAIEACTLYDACIFGGADHVMVHGMCGDADSPCVTRLLGDGTGIRKHFRKWSDSAWTTVGGDIGFLQGTILHLWHGATPDRRYLERNQLLQTLDFDPERDMRIGSNGCWSLLREDIENCAKSYFQMRREDRM